MLPTVQEEKIEPVEDMDEGDESDMEIDSMGVELNERLRAAATLREAGITTTVLEEEWERWFDAAEAGDLLLDGNIPSQISTTFMPPRPLNTAFSTNAPLNIQQWQPSSSNLNSTETGYQESLLHLTSLQQRFQ
jgi:hypothetical protein